MFNILQVKTGTINGATSATVTFDTATTAGTTVVILGLSRASSGSGDARFWAPTGGAGTFNQYDTRNVSLDTNSSLMSWFKENVAGGETTYTFPIVTSVASVGCWAALEVEGLEVAQASTPQYITAASGASAPGSVSSTTTTSVPENSNDTTLAYSSMALAYFGAYNASTTQPVISGYTSSLQEIAQVPVTGSGFSLTLAVAVNAFWDVGRFSITADVSPSCPFIGDLIIHYTQDSKWAPLYDAFTGFEFGTATGLTSGSIAADAGVKQFDSSAGSPEIVSTIKRSGNYALKLSSTAAAEWVAWTDPGVLSYFQPNVSVGSDYFFIPRVNFYFDTSLPSADTVLWSVEVGSAANGVVVRYINASQKIGVKIGSGTEQVSDATVAANKWIGVTGRYWSTSTTHTFEWSMDYDSLAVTSMVAQTTATTSSMTSARVTALVIGWKSSQTATVYYDDPIVSKLRGNYPIGKDKIVPLLPDATDPASVQGTTSNFQTFSSNGTGTAFNGTTCQNNLRDIPPTIGASSNGVMQVTTASGESVKIPMETLTLTDKVPRAVKWSFAPWAASATTATLGIQVIASGQTIFLVTAADHGQDDTNLIWICGVVRPSRGTPVRYWQVTKARLDALECLVGFSTDASPDIGVHAVLVEVAYSPADVVGILDGEDSAFKVYARQDPLSSSVASYLGTTPSGTRGMTMYGTVSGVDWSQYVGPNTTYEKVIDASSIAEVTAVGMTPDPTV